MRARQSPVGTGWSNGKKNLTNSEYREPLARYRAGLALGATLYSLNIGLLFLPGKPPSSWTEELNFVSVLVLGTSCILFTYYRALAKGYRCAPAVLLSLLCQPLGALLVGCLPDRARDEEETVATTVPPFPQQAAAFSLAAPLTAVLISMVGLAEPVTPVALITMTLLRWVPVALVVAGLALGVTALLITKGHVRQSLARNALGGIGVCVLVVALGLVA